jgi:hypothetical protein
MPIRHFLLPCPLLPVTQTRAEFLFTQAYNLKYAFTEICFTDDSAPALFLMALQLPIQTIAGRRGGYGELRVEFYQSELDTGLGYFIRSHLTQIDYVA